MYRSRISEKKFKQILHLFCLDLTAVQITELTGLSHDFINKYMKAIHGHIAECYEQESLASGQVEVDESLFGLYKRNGKVYAEIAPDASKKILQGII